MYCPYCGKEIPDNAYICVNCSRKVENYAVTSDDKAGAGWFWLGFFVPVAGFLIWIFTSDSTPKKAKKAGIGALVGIGISILAAVLFFIIFLVIIRIGTASLYPLL